MFCFVLFFIDGGSRDSCDFGVLMRRGELRAFLLCHLGYNLPSHSLLIRNHALKTHFLDKMETHKIFIAT